MIWGQNYVGDAEIDTEILNHDNIPPQTHDGVNIEILRSKNSEMQCGSW